MLHLYSTALLAVIAANALVIFLAIVGVVNSRKHDLQQSFLACSERPSPDGNTTRKVASRQQSPTLQTLHRGQSSRVSEWRGLHDPLELASISESCSFSIAGDK